MMQNVSEKWAAESAAWEQKTLNDKIMASCLALDRSLLKASGGLSSPYDDNTPAQVAADFKGWSLWAGHILTIVKAEICASVLEKAAPYANLDPPVIDLYKMYCVAKSCTDGYENNPWRAALVLARQVAAFFHSPEHLHMLVDTINSRPHVRAFVKMELYESHERVKPGRPSPHGAAANFLEQCLGRRGAIL